MRQGLSSQLLRGAYRVYYREAWHAIRQRAHKQDVDRVLVHVVNLVWSWIRTMTSAASEAYIAGAARVAPAPQLASPTVSTGGANTRAPVMG